MNLASPLQGHRSNCHSDDRRQIRSTRRRPSAPRKIRPHRCCTAMSPEHRGHGTCSSWDTHTGAFPRFSGPPKSNIGVTASAGRFLLVSPCFLDCRSPSRTLHKLRMLMWGRHPTSLPSPMPNSASPTSVRAPMLSPTPFLLFLRLRPSTLPPRLSTIHDTRVS